MKDAKEPQVRLGLLFFWFCIALISLFIISLQPKSLLHHLKDYQLEAINWLYTLKQNKLSGILGDESTLNSRPVKAKLTPPTLQWGSVKQFRQLHS